MVVKPDKSALSGLSEKSASRIRATLKADIRMSSQTVQAVAERISRKSSTFYKSLDGTISLSLGHLLVALDVIGVEPGDFFARALGTDNTSAALLAALEPLGTVHSRMKRLEKTLRSLETAPINPEPPRNTDAEPLVAKLIACVGKEQRRRISTAERYRDPAVAHRYLEHLDALRYDQPKQAILNAEAVAVRLVPHLRGSREERLALAVKALTIYGSAHRQVGGFATAARAMRVALRTSQRNQLSGLMADILQRGAYVLSDHGRFVEAMKLLDEALVINIDLGYDLGVGMTLVDRGFILNSVGSYSASVTVLAKALPDLQGDSHHVRRNRLAAYEVLSANYRSLGQLDRADKALALALEEFQDSGQLNLAKIRWQQGAVALEREAPAEAEERFREALAVFHRTDGPERALVTLDLAKTLLSQGRVNEAMPLAVGIVDYLKSFRGNRVASAAISGFAQLAIRGKISLREIEEVEQVLRGNKPYHSASR